MERIRYLSSLYCLLFIVIEIHADDSRCVVAAGSTPCGPSYIRVVGRNLYAQRSGLAKSWPDIARVAFISKCIWRKCAFCVCIGHVIRDVNPKTITHILGGVQRNGHCANGFAARDNFYCVCVCVLCI